MAGFGVGARYEDSGTLAVDRSDLGSGRTIRFASALLLLVCSIWLSFLNVYIHVEVFDFSFATNPVPYGFLLRLPYVMGFCRLQRRRFSPSHSFRPFRPCLIPPRGHQCFPEVIGVDPQTPRHRTLGGLVVEELSEGFIDVFGNVQYD